MITAIVLASTIAFETACIPPPLALVQGTYRESAFMGLFDQLETGNWKAADLRFGERSNGRKVIIFGRHDRLKAAFLAAGWHVLEPPYQARSATLVFYLPHLSGNVAGIQRILRVVGVWIQRGGFLVAPPFDAEDFIPHPHITDLQAEDFTRFVMAPFSRRLGGVKVYERYYDVYEKRNRRSA